MLFVKADREMEKLGFEKVQEDEFGVTYLKKINEHNFVHRIDIVKKSDGNYLVQSYQTKTNSDGYNNCVGLTHSEMKAIMKKYRELKRKYRW